MLIRDAIHGSIEFNALEEKIIGSPLVQRLHFVKQLGTAYLVFPSAQHTRFEHSIGAMHLTGSLCRRLGIDEAKSELLRISALLHDVGHGSFAHDTEGIMMRLTGVNHEKRGLELVKKSPLADEIEAEGLSFKELGRLMEGEGLGSMLTSELGTDRIDYLMRDAYFTGVAYSLIDADRLLHSMAVKEGRVYVTEKGRLAAESLLVSRYFMFNVVYYHPTVRIAGGMAVKAIETAIENGDITTSDALCGTDYGVLSALAPKHPLAARVLERRLLKKALVVDTAADEVAAKFIAGNNALKEIEDALAGAGIGRDGYVACMPLTHTKPLSVPLLTNDGRVIDIAKTSSIITGVQQERRERHFILGVAEENKEKAAKAVARLF